MDSITFPLMAQAKHSKRRKLTSVAGKPVRRGKREVWRLSSGARLTATAVSTAIMDDALCPQERERGVLSRRSTLHVLVSTGQGTELERMCTVHGNLGYEEGGEDLG